MRREMDRLVSAGRRSASVVIPQLTGTMFVSHSRHCYHRPTVAVSAVVGSRWGTSTADHPAPRRAMRYEWWVPDPTILLLSTSDTDLITARASGARYRWANPSRLVDGELDEHLDGADLVVVRILGGYRSWQDGIDTVVASGVPTVVVSGEQVPDADLMSHSTVPAGVAVQAHIYLAQGGVENLRQLHAFLCDTVLMTGFGFGAPVTTPSWGILDRPAVDGAGPTIAVLYYRAQQLAGNTGYVEALCSAIEDAGGRPLPVYCASLRTAEPEMLDVLKSADAMVTTVLAAGGAVPAAVSAGGSDDTWNVAHLAALDIPILQGLCLTSSRSGWHDNDDGLSPLDVATQVAVPEFDGRIITVPFSFKEIDDEGLISYVADPERCARVAGLAVRHARLRAIAAGGQARGGRVLRVPDQARPHRQRGRARHPGERGRPAARHARCRLRHRRHPRRGRAGRRRTDSRAHRARRSGPGLAHRRAAGGQSNSAVRQRLPRVVRHTSRRTHRRRRETLGTRAGKSVRRPHARPARARSSSPHCSPATSC